MSIFQRDGTLAGYISAATVQGAESQGVYAYIKHFALYEMNAQDGLRLVKRAGNP